MIDTKVLDEAVRRFPHRLNVLRASRLGPPLEDGWFEAWAKLIREEYHEILHPVAL